MSETKKRMEVGADELTWEAVCNALRAKYGDDATVEEWEVDAAGVLENYIFGATGEFAVTVLPYEDGPWEAKVEQIRACPENVDFYGLDLYRVETLEIVAVRPRGRSRRNAHSNASAKLDRNRRA